MSSFKTKFDNDPEKVDLSYTFFSNSDTGFIAEKLTSNRNLKTLCLNGNNITFDGLTVIVEALKKNTTITSLDLGDNAIDSRGTKLIGDLLSTNSTLNHLYVAKCSINFDSCSPISAAIKDNTSLLTLDLGGNSISIKGAINLAEILKTNKTLTSLSLEDNKIDDDGAIAIGEMLEINKTIKKINLSSNSISSDGVSAIAKSIEKNTQSALEVLDLSNNEIGTDGGKVLAKAIKACKSTKLTTLLIKGGKIRDEGLKAFCLMLKGNKSITSLDFERNFIKDAGIKMLSEILKTNTTIKSLVLNNNRIGDDGAKALDKALDSNKTLTSISLDGNFFTNDTTVNIIKETVKQNKKNSAKAPKEATEAAPAASASAAATKEEKPPALEVVPLVPDGGKPFFVSYLEFKQRKIESGQASLPLIDFVALEIQKKSEEELIQIQQKFQKPQEQQQQQPQQPATTPAPTPAQPAAAPAAPAQTEVKKPPKINKLGLLSMKKLKTVRDEQTQNGEGSTLAAAAAPAAQGGVGVPQAKESVAGAVAPTSTAQPPAPVAATPAASAAAAPAGGDDGKKQEQGEEKKPEPAPLKLNGMKASTLFNKAYMAKLKKEEEFTPDGRKRIYTEDVKEMDAKAASEWVGTLFDDAKKEITDLLIKDAITGNKLILTTKEELMQLGASSASARLVTESTSQLMSRSTSQMKKSIFSRFTRRVGAILRAMPPGWVEDRDPATGKVIYINKSTGKTQMERPKMTVKDMPFFTGKVTTSSLNKLFGEGSIDFYEPLEDSLKKANFQGWETMLQWCNEKVAKIEKQGVLDTLSMEREEALAIFIYTYGSDESPYLVLNRALATRNEATIPNYRGYIVHLLSALRKLPRYRKKGVLYRGIDANYAAWNQAEYAVGNTLTWPAFTSTSASEASTSRFLMDAVKPIIFEIRGEFNGCNIMIFSFLKEEEEVLLEPETKFVIKSIISPDTKIPSATRYIVEIVKTEPILKTTVERFENNRRKRYNPQDK